jgi:hypothetical protein
VHERAEQRVRLEVTELQSAQSEYGIESIERIRGHEDGHEDDRSAPHEEEERVPGSGARTLPSVEPGAPLVKHDLGTMLSAVAAAPLACLDLGVRLGLDIRVQVSGAVLRACRSKVSI